MDDVALNQPAAGLNFPLNEVGLENVQTLVTFQGQRIPAKADAVVSLTDPDRRGIHMSRLFKALARLPERELDWNWLNALVYEMLVSHDGLSDRIRVRLAFEMPLERTALVSGEKGWRTYPVTFEAEAGKTKRHLIVSARVLYSSTCPCSLALSRQVIRDQFAKDFVEENVAREQVLNWMSKPEFPQATPHAQRSEAIARVRLSEGEVLELPELIDLMERSLATPVQTAVKRSDEQEFARLNAQNPMFCEDAARRLKQAFESQKKMADYQIEVRHFESLHPHDVVAKVSKY